MNIDKYGVAANITEYHIRAKNWYKAVKHNTKYGHTYNFRL